MNDQPRTQRVQVRCADAAPADRVRRASGVSEVEVDGDILRCRVTGSFQPFLEALRGSEVVSLSTHDQDSVVERSVTKEEP
jgi:hypothetical protein